MGLFESVSAAHDRAQLDVICWLFLVQWVGGGERSRPAPTDPSWLLLKDRMTQNLLALKIDSLFSLGVLSSRYNNS